jgi:hypothetical protein
MRVIPTIAIRFLAALLTGLLGLGASEFAPADINELIRFRGASEAPPVKEVRQAAVASGYFRHDLPASAGRPPDQLSKRSPAPCISRPIPD